eukprot:CAMPEP_0195514258 /NCGR_PEP_ID=MMETSP0794_2-20130614/5698_1 /TAXON_ID=515487 /ORGANISM="Stephanopyxis turris, Strain CCMP 815" /LENGTH=660 /DNA_ID=CAMNT_0040642459 /DNA_START=436 /DNA_END=2418 /DNA_ORIENTATION=+
MSIQSKDAGYTWHLSLRVDRPVEGCTMRPHAYMYSKKLDERDVDKPLPPHSKKCRDPPPNHEFVYRWLRGPRQEPCAYEGCPRRTSFSPHDWSKHALGGGCSLQCISVQSSLYKATFCNSNCFVLAWKTQYTVPQSSLSSPAPQSRRGSESHKRGGSVGMPDDDRSVGSAGSIGFPPASNYIPHCSSGGSVASTGSDNGDSSPNSNPAGPLTPGGSRGYQPYPSFNDFGASQHDSEQQNDEWTEMSRDLYYIPTNEDLGRKLQLEATAVAMDGEVLMHRVVKTDLVLSRAPDPIKRNLVTVKGGGGGGGGGGARFRIVTYNVLAEIYATQQQYPYCDFWALSWDYRFQNILRELVDVGPDVICLQEIQADHYENHVYNALSDAGFEGVYKQKTRASMGLAGKVDGCALFWRRTKFHLVESYSIELNELAVRQAQQLGMNRRSEDGSAYLNRLSRDNVAQLVVLELVNPTLPTRSNREPINQVCIANTHLYSHKDFPDVKLWQTWQLLQELETFVMSRGTNLPLMLCGDFNSTPDTAVYDLLHRQAVHPGHPDVNMANGDDGTVTNILPDVMAMTHTFQLGSVYNTVMGDEPQFTNYTVNFKGVLDYMWYSAQNLRPLSAAPIPDEDTLTRHGEALPSTQFSSDHVMLISDMQIMSGSRPP